jgi:hypothetical protein
MKSVVTRVEREVRRLGSAPGTSHNSMYYDCTTCRYVRRCYSMQAAGTLADVRAACRRRKNAFFIWFFCRNKFSRVVCSKSLEVPRGALFIYFICLLSVSAVSAVSPVYAVVVSCGDVRDHVSCFLVKIIRKFRGGGVGEGMEPAHGHNPERALAQMKREFGEHGGVTPSIERSSTFT